MSTDSFNSKLDRQHTPHITYSQYVDDFQYYCTCINKLRDSPDVTTYRVVREITFCTDKNGDVILLEVKALHGTGDNNERAILDGALASFISDLIQKAREEAEIEARIDELIKAFTAVIGDKNSPSSRYSKVTRLFNKYLNERYKQLKAQQEEV